MVRFGYIDGRGLGSRIGVPAYANPPSESVVDTLTMADCVRIAEERSPLMRAAREGLEALKQQYEEAWWAWFPNARLRTIGVIIPPQPVGEPILEVVDSANGNAATDLRVLQGPDLSDWNAGLDLQLNIDLPLYTFGKLKALRSMASAGVDIDMPQSESRAEPFRPRAWWGFVVTCAR